MKEQLIHILDESVCLSRRQLKDYLGGSMLPIENHAVEVHLNTCPLCRMAVEGFEENIGEATAALESLNSNFLKEHFDNIAPQIHLNSMSPTAALLGDSAKNTTSRNLWRNASIAAAILLAFGALWYLEFGEKALPKNNRLAQNTLEQKEKPIQNAPAPEATKTAPIGLAAEQQATTEHSGKAELLSPIVAQRETSKTSSENLTTDKDLDRAKTPAGKPSLERDEIKAVPMVAKNATAGTFREQESASTQKESYETNAYKKSRALEPTLSRASARQEEKSAIADVPLKTLLQKGDELFEAGKYEKALTNYSQQMQTGTKEEQTSAAIKAARCYALLGNKARATELLKYIIATGNGHDRRAAKKALRTIDSE